MNDFRTLMLGDTAFIIEFPDLSGVRGARQIRSLRTRVQEKVDHGELAGVVDLISATRSLTVCLEPLHADFEAIVEIVGQLAVTSGAGESASGQLWTLPACYAGEYAVDLEDIARKSELSPDEVIGLHCDQVFDVLLIGFLPGLPYMAGLPDRLQFPRRTNPRKQVPAGSVAIANDQTVIYPWESPGGWHLLGRCPVPMFDPAWERPSLLSPGDQVQFQPVNEEQFRTIQKDLATGKTGITSFLQEHREAT